MSQETVTLKFTKKQAEAARTANSNIITLFGGAIRGGKTWWLILMIWQYAIKFPKSRWVIIRATVPTLEATTMVTFQKLLDFGLSNDVVDYDSKYRIVTLYNDSKIIFMSESFDIDKDLNRFKGLEINGAGFDEINEINENTFLKIIERSGSWQHSPNCPIKILATCNPASNWVKEKFYDKWKLNNLPKGWAYIPAKITDNPHLSSDYISSLNLLPKYQYKVFVEGEWDIQLKTGGEFYKCFELDKHVGQCNYNPDLPLHISFDENVNPYLPCGIFQIHKITDLNSKVTSYEVQMIDEIAAKTPNNTIFGICKEIKRKYPNHISGMFIYGDATASKEDTKVEKGFNFFRLILEELKQYKPSLRVSPSNPSVIMRGNWINTLFEKQIGNISITFGEQCNLAINDFVNLKEAADGTKLKEMETDPKTKVRYQKVGHFSDLFDYFICNAFASEFLAYQKGSISFNVKLGKNLSKNSY